MYKSEILKKAREQDSSLQYVSDNEIIKSLQKTHPSLVIEDDPTTLDKIWSAWKAVGSWVVDFSEAVVEWIDNVATDITNNTIWKITGIKYKPAREYIVPTWEEYQGGLLQRSLDTIWEKGQIVADSIEYWASWSQEWFVERNKKQAVWTYQGAWAVVWGVTSVLWDMFMSGIKTVAPNSMEEYVKKKATDVAQNTEVWKNVVNLMNEYSENMEFLKKNDPNAYRTYQAHFSYLEWLAELTWVKKVGWVFKAGDVSNLKNISKDAIAKMNQEIFNKASTGIEKIAGNMWEVKNKTFEKANEIFGNMPKTSKEYQKAISPDWIEYEVEKTPTLFENINDKVFRKNNQEMAVQSVFPKQTKEKGIKARLRSWEIALDSVEQLYNDRAKWIITANINEMWGGVEWVDEAMSYWGKKIWEYTDINYTVDLTDEVSELKNVLTKQFAKLNPEMYNRVNRVVTEFEASPEVSIKALQEWMSNIKSDVFSNFEITKQLASSSTWKGLSKFLDGLQDKFDTSIDVASGWSKELKQAKTAYSKYKKIQKDLTDSYIVSQRQAWKGLSKTAWAMWGAYEILQNPSISWIMKWLILKQSWELISKARSRDGNWEMLIRNMDRKGVEQYNLNRQYVPKTENLAGNNGNTPNKSDSTSSMSDSSSDMDSPKLVVSEEEVLEAVQDIAKQIEENLWDTDNLLEIKQAIQEYPLPDRYKDFLDQKVNNYIKNVDDYKKQMEAEMVDTDVSDIYWDSLVKAFNRLEGIQKRTKTTKGWDKMTTVEFQNSPAYKTFSDNAQEYINERDLDMTVQELFEQMGDNLSSWPRFQTAQQAGTETFAPIPKFTNEAPVTSFLMKELEWKTMVSKGFIENITRQQGVKKWEIVLIQDTLAEFAESGKKVSAKEFADKMQEKMTRLEKSILYWDEWKYSDYGEEQTPLQIAEHLWDEADYTEVVYNFDDFKTDGSTHYDDDNYFWHVRNVNYVKDWEKYRVISEKQSDLFQQDAGRYKRNTEDARNMLESQIKFKEEKLKDLTDTETIEALKKDIEADKTRLAEKQVGPDEKYKIDLNIKEAHPRLTREEIQRAINDGQDYILFPKGKAVPYYEWWLKAEWMDWNVWGSGWMSADDLKELRTWDEFEMWGEDFVRTDTWYDPYGISGVRKEDIDNRFDLNQALDEEFDSRAWEFESESWIKRWDAEFEEKMREWADENTPEYMVEPLAKDDWSDVNENDYLRDLEEIYWEMNVAHNSDTGEVLILRNGEDTQYFEYDSMWGEEINPRDFDYDELRGKATDVWGEAWGWTMDYYEKILPKEVAKEAKKFGAEVDMEFEDDLGLPYVKVDLTKSKDKVWKAIEVFERKWQWARDQIDSAEAVKIVRKYFNSDEVWVEVVDKIITPEWLEALGKYKDEIITFSKNPASSTPEHEVLHAYFDTMTPFKQKAQLLSEVKATQKLKSNIDAEEWLADNFVEFVKGRNVKWISEKMKQYFTDIWDSMKALFGKEDKINSFYKDIEKLRWRNKVNKAQASAVIATGAEWEDENKEE